MSGSLLMGVGTIVKIIGNTDFVASLTGNYAKITNVIEKTDGMCPYKIVTKRKDGRYFNFWTYEEELKQVTDPAEIEYAKIMEGL